MPQLYMIGGPNGAGKTTVAADLLPKLLDCYEYINADAIAAALSPFAPETTAIQAGRLMLKRVDQIASEGANFAFETTMASRSFVPFLKDCKKQGYQINLIYLWLQTPELAIGRVKDRVLTGGHDIPEDIILRRYERSINNFLKLYTPIADEWFLYENTLNKPFIFAEKVLDKSPIIFDEQLWKKFKGYSDE